MKKIKKNEGIGVSFANTGVTLALMVVLLTPYQVKLALRQQLARANTPARVTVPVAPVVIPPFTPTPIDPVPYTGPAFSTGMTYGQQLAVRQGLAIANAVDVTP